MKEQANCETSPKLRTVHVNGTDMFRLVAIFGSLISAALSLFITAIGPRSCQEAPLEIAVLLCAGAHIGTFLLLLASYICPGCLSFIGRLLSIFYFLLVGTMVSVQVIFFHGSGCNIVAPILYYWIFTNISLFYVLVAYGLSLWGAYICWEVDEEEEYILQA